MVWNADTVKGCQPQLSRLVKIIRGGEGGRGHWGGSEEEFLERNMGALKFGGRQSYILQGGGTMAFSRGTRVPNGIPSHNKESPRRKQRLTRSSRGIDDDDYDNDYRYRENQRGRCGGVVP